MKILALFIALALAAPASGAELQGQPASIEQSAPSDSTGLQDPASADEINAYLSGDTGPAPSGRQEEGTVGFLVALGLIVLAFVIFWTLRQSPRRASMARSKNVPPPEVETPPSAAKERRQTKKKRSA